MTHQPLTTTFDNSAPLRESNADTKKVDPKPIELKAKLRSAGLRPTVQRLSLSKLLFGNGDRHVSAE
ncbi:MAG: transcriptional repressor, partial [Methylocystis sp.]|nr:transcriptional repressor [Methylocystis sp.]